MSRHRRAFLASLGGGLSFLSGCASRERPSADRTTSAGPRAIVVDGARGSAAGVGTDDAPYGTIMRGFEAASPGDTIEVRPGEYAEPVVTPHGGEPGKPITITGPPEAVLTSDRDRFQPLKIQDSHVHLRGLTVDGLWDPDNPEDPSSYAHSPLIQPRPRADTDEYLVDLVVAPHRVGNARAHVISTTRVRDVEIGPMVVIGPAGTYYLLDDDVEGHVGEIVYLGTPPDTYGKSHYPWDGLDLTRNVHVHHVDNSAGHWHSELVNTKLGTRNVLVEYCTDGGGSLNEHDFPAASVRFQSYDSTLRWCDLRDGLANGVSLHGSGKSWLADRGDPPFDPARLGTGYEVYGNRIRGFQEHSFWFEDADPADQLLCENEFDRSVEIVGPPVPDSDYGETCPADAPEGDGIGHTGGVRVPESIT